MCARVSRLKRTFEMQLLFGRGGSSSTGRHLKRQSNRKYSKRRRMLLLCMRNSEWRHKIDKMLCFGIFTAKKLSRLVQICMLSMMLMGHFTMADFDWTLVRPMRIASMSGEALHSETFRIGRKIDEPELDMELEGVEGDDDDDSGGGSDVEPAMLEDDFNAGQMAMDRIYGGNVATQFCFPYQVGLLLQRPRGLYWCGGSLISDEYVLTAAHCVDKAKRALVFLGAHEIKNAKEVGQVRLMVNQSNFIIFPTWNSRRLKDDIAIVKLPVPIEFNERISPISLPKRSYEYRNFRNKLAIASGWGRYASGVHAISGVLRFVKLRIVEGEMCKRSFPLSYRSTNICTSGKYEKSTCNGDSGGPLVLQRKLSKERLLVGITSFGSIFGCDRGYPAAFTKVASYLDWISDETGIEPLEWKPEADLFSRYNDKAVSSRHLTDSKEFCADLSDDPDNNDDDGIVVVAGNTARDNEKLLYKHEQRFPDGTLLKTQFYHGQEIYN